MVKFYKPGKVVIILNGRFAGHKGIIVKSNYESGKDKKYPYCTIVGLSKGPRKPTKKNLSKLQDKIKKLESASKDDKAKILKSFGVFIKTYNMSHLLATRYAVKEDFGIVDSVTKIDNLQKKIKEQEALIQQKEKSRKEEKANEKEKGKEDQKEKYQQEIEALKSKLGSQNDELKKEKKNIKINIGAEMYKRYMQGFNKGKDNELEEQKHTLFLFKKLHF
jgi:large subunit ribosomal protein L27e